MLNNVSLLLCTLPLYGTFSTALKELSTLMKGIKKGVDPFAFGALADLVAWLPSYFMQIIGFWLIAKTTLIFSNVPGPKTPFVYRDTEGKPIKSKKLIGFIPGLSDCALGIAAISHVDTLTMTV